MLSRCTTVFFIYYLFIYLFIGFALGHTACYICLVKNRVWKSCRKDAVKHAVIWFMLAQMLTEEHSLIAFHH